MQNIVEVNNLSYTYMPGTPYEKKALNDVSFSLGRGECLGIIGSNGSGKTTLIQHLNGLLAPVEGSVLIDGVDTAQKDVQAELWKKVGLVFQYPEQQLFEATVEEDVAYGPKNLGLSSEEVKRRVADSLTWLGLDYGDIKDLPPLTLSGGTRRRVAIAGILAIQPEIIVFDEPAAGLDYIGQKKILDLLSKLQKEKQTTVIIVSHSIRELIPLANKLLVLEKGNVSFYGDTVDIVTSPRFVEQYGYMLPDYMQLINKLIVRGKRLNSKIKSIEEAESQIEALIKNY